jgi:hypothetical protein
MTKNRPGPRSGVGGESLAKPGNLAALPHLRQVSRAGTVPAADATGCRCSSTAVVDRYRGVSSA